jgi:hypothetical protein
MIISLLTSIKKSKAFRFSGALASFLSFQGRQWRPSASHYRKDTNAPFEVLRSLL